MKKTALKIEKLLLCDSAFLSVENKLNIIGIFDNIYSTKVPTTHPLMFLVGMISSDKPNYKDKLTLELKAPNGEKMLENNNIEVRTSIKEKGNFIIKIPIIQLKDYGVYTISVLKDNHILATTSFSLVRLGGQGDKGNKAGKLPN